MFVLRSLPEVAESLVPPAHFLRASQPGAFMAPRQPHSTRLFTTCTCSAAAGRSTVERLTFRAVTRTLSFDHT